MKKYSKFGYLTAIAALMLSPAAAQDSEPTDIEQNDAASVESLEADVDADLDAELADIDSNLEAELDEIDAELAAELEAIDAELRARLDRIAEFERKLSDPKELLNTFALKKPLIELPTPEPDRLIIAQRITARLFPAGTNERVVKSLMDDLVRPMIDRTLELNLVEAIALFGIDEDLLPETTDDEKTATFADLIVDMEPEYREKMDAVFDAYIEVSGLTSKPIEPALAGAMARDYARKYDMAQLNDLDTFFSTPTGALFAQDFMLSTASIDMVQTVFQELPALAENSDRIQEITENIQEILKPSKTKPIIEERCDDCNIPEVAEPDYDDTISDRGDEPWFDQDNWNETTRTNVEKLSDSYNELAELGEQAYQRYGGAFDAAIAESRAQYIADGWTRDDAN